jgi:hypothetical protein
MINELNQLTEQTFGDLNGPFVAGRVERNTDLVGQSPQAARGWARNRPR